MFPKRTSPFHDRCGGRVLAGGRPVEPANDACPGAITCPATETTHVVAGAYPGAITCPATETTHAASSRARSACSRVYSSVGMKSIAP